MEQGNLRGKTLQFTFDDGPMAHKTFEHRIGKDGSVAFRAGGSDAPFSSATKADVSAVGKDVYAVSYLSSSGYTLTAVLDYRTGELTAFSSNEKDLNVQHGTFKTGAID
jgi:hypothetical protein